MEYALKRQLSFGTVFIFLVIVTGLSLYQAFTPKSTCFDRIKNQGEEQVDCGGLYCQACKVMKLEDAQVLSRQVFQVGDTYDAVAQVQNPNEQRGTHELSYTFTFYDADKNIIGQKTGNTYFLAGQTRYIIENNVALAKPVAFMDFTVDPVAWEEQKISLGPAALPIFSKKYEQGTSGQNGFAHVTGTVQNQSPYSFSLADIAVVLLDKNRTPIGVGKTQINGLRFNESRDFTVLFAKDTPLPAEIYAEATANIFDSSNVR
jgi:hypothetical protein